MVGLEGRVVAKCCCFPDVRHRLILSVNLTFKGSDFERPVAVELETDALLAMSRY